MNISVSSNNLTLPTTQQVHYGIHESLLNNKYTITTTGWISLILIAILGFFAYLKAEPLGQWNRSIGEIEYKSVHNEKMLIVLSHLLFVLAILMLICILIIYCSNNDMVGIVLLYTILLTVLASITIQILILLEKDEQFDLNNDDKMKNINNILKKIPFVALIMSLVVMISIVLIDLLTKDQNSPKNEQLV